MFGVCIRLIRLSTLPGALALNCSWFGLSVVFTDVFQSAIKKKYEIHSRGTSRFVCCFAKLDCDTFLYCWQQVRQSNDMP